MTLLRAASYLRQSIDLGEGIDRQRARTRELAAARGWTLVEEYEDNDTSATKTRGAKTSWARMLRDAEAGKIDTLVAVDLDRLIRSPRDLLTLIDAGLSVVTVDGALDLTSADGELRATMLAAFARFEVRHKGDRQKRANAYRVAQGRPVPGRRRFGYESDNITPREEEASVVRGLFSGFLDGQSIRSLAIAADLRPVRVREIFLNRAYSGEVQHLGVWSPSVIVPLVTPEVQAQAIAVLADPARRTSPGSAVKYVASGIALCGECGSTLHYMRGYKCSAATNHVHINKDALEEAIMREVWHSVAWNETGPEDGAPELREVILARAEIARQTGVAQELAMMPGADLAAVRRTLAALGRKAEALAAEEAEIRGRAAQSSILDAVHGEWWAQQEPDVEGLEKAWDAWPAYWEGLGLERQREVLRGLLEVTVEKGRAEDRVKFRPLV